MNNKIQLNTQRRRVRLDHGLIRILTIPLGFVWFATASAAQINENLAFGIGGQSQWATGPALGFSTNGPQFLGIPSVHGGNSIGGIDKECFLGVCAKFGAKLGAEISGRAGLDYDIKIDSGSLTITFPQRVTLTVPDPYSVRLGGDFRITAAVTPSTVIHFSDAIDINGHSVSGFAAPKAMQTFGPTVQAIATMNLDAHLFGGAEVCLVTCAGPAIDEGFTKSQELLALNHNNDGQIRVLGDVVAAANVQTTIDKGAISLTAQLPTLNSDSRTSGGFDGTRLHSGERSNVFGLNASLDRIVSDILGLPPLHGTTGPFGYNLLTANGALNVDVKQNFTFDPNLEAKLHFSHTVQLASGGGAFSDITIPIGGSVDLKAPGTLSLGVAPTFTLNNTLRNQTSLIAGGQVSVSAGGVSAFGLSLGPLFKDQTSGDLFEIPLVDNPFHVNMPDLATRPFNLLFALNLASDRLNSATSGYALGSLAGECVPSAVNTCAGVAIKQGIYQVEDLYDLFVSSDGEQDCSTEFCDPGFLIQPDTHLSLFSQTSQALLDDLTQAPVFFNDLSTLFNTNALAVANDDDEDARQRLASLGFTGAYPDFIIPDGAPFPNVPEPSTFVLFSIGILGWARRAVSARRAHKLVTRNS